MGNGISGNSIHSNTGIGIDLNGDGVIDGSLNSVALTTYRIEFFESTACDGTGNGEGETFLGSGNATTDGGGDVNFSITVASNATVSNFITATATDLGATTNTSEFSDCVTVIPTFTEYTFIMLAVAMMALLLWYFR